MASNRTRKRERRAACSHVKVSALNASEKAFVDWAGDQGWSLPHRSGWPDFLLSDPTGKLFAVEVKTGGDKVQPHQSRTFHLLQEAGIPVFVWRPEDPRLLPWRQDKHPQRRKLVRKHLKAKTRHETTDRRTTRQGSPPPAPAGTTSARDQAAEYQP